jgi:hypothetical protein
MTSEPGTMRFDLRHHPRPAVMLWSVAGDRDPLPRDEELGAHADCHLQASGADIQDAGGGVPGHNGTGEDEGDLVVGHLVALAQDLGPPVAAVQEGGEPPRLTVINRAFLPKPCRGVWREWTPPSPRSDTRRSAAAGHSWPRFGAVSSSSSTLDAYGASASTLGSRCSRLNAPSTGTQGWTLRASALPGVSPPRAAVLGVRSRITGHAPRTGPRAPTDGADSASARAPKSERATTSRCLLAPADTRSSSRTGRGSGGSGTARKSVLPAPRAMVLAWPLSKPPSVSMRSSRRRHHDPSALTSSPPEPG